MKLSKEFKKSAKNAGMAGFCFFLTGFCLNALMNGTVTDGIAVALYSIGTIVGAVRGAVAAVEALPQRISTHKPA